MIQTFNDVIVTFFCYFSKYTPLYSCFRVNAKKIYVQSLLIFWRAELFPVKYLNAFKKYKSVLGATRGGLRGGRGSGGTPLGNTVKFLFLMFKLLLCKRNIYKETQQLDTKLQIGNKIF